MDPMTKRKKRNQCQWLILLNIGYMPIFKITFRLFNRNMLEDATSLMTKTYEDTSIIRDLPTTWWLMVERKEATNQIPVGKKTWFFTQMVCKVGNGENMMNLFAQVGTTGATWRINRKVWLILLLVVDNRKRGNGFIKKVPSGYVKIAIEAMAIEIVSFPIKNGDVPYLC